MTVSRIAYGVAGHRGNIRAGPRYRRARNGRRLFAPPGQRHDTFTEIDRPLDCGDLRRLERSAAEAQQKRHELLDGTVYAMVSEQAGHARLKFAIQTQFAGQIAGKALPCEVFPDGMAVKVDEDTVFEPDALVRRGLRLGDDDLLILDPIIVVEIASPSTQRLDASLKFTRYFRNTSIVHYLIVVADGRTLIHHRRVGDHVRSTNHTEGTIELAPPGIALDVEALFAAALDDGFDAGPRAETTLG